MSAWVFKCMELIQFYIKKKQPQKDKYEESPQSC